MKKERYRRPEAQAQLFTNSQIDSPAQADARVWASSSGPLKLGFYLFRFVYF